ncbi:MAG: hypothetical protein HY907_03965 [Deltaproteobacteria bacterium]|nr:hypothetical protein [Deltaproteobacteria bacterium]
MTRSDGVGNERRRAAWRGAVGLAILAASGCSTGGDTTPPGDVGREDRGEGGDVAGDTVVCVDWDDDGFGPGCAAGPDCDDSDGAHHDDCADCATTHAPGCRCSPGESFDCYDGPPWTEDVGACRGGARACLAGIIPEACAGQVLPAASPDVLCNDLDDDCDGVGDESLAGPCGTCDPECESEGETTPSAGDPGATGLAPNPDGTGGVVLGAEDIHAGYLWAANDPDGSVSKLDLESGAEVARYKVGLWGDNCDSPSRTAVDGFGNAYVAARAHVGCSGRNQGSVTKMAGDPIYCVDRNGDTAIQTSTGPTPLPLGTDECVLWTVPVAGAGGIPRGLAIDLGDGEFHPGGYPWVASWTEQRVYQLNPDDGAVLATVDLGVQPYGLAADALGNIWVSGRAPSPGYLQKFNTVSRVVDPPVQFGGASGCTAEPYGITVDRDNRPWAACWVGSDACGAGLNPDGSWIAVHTGRSNWGGRGIAAAADGTIWMSIHENWGGGAMVSWNMVDGSGMTIRDIAGVIPVGIALDELDHVWTVNQTTGNVTRLTLATSALEEFPVGPSPYTYSDFTGYQRRRLVPRGTWTHDYHRCDLNAGDSWGMIYWDVTAPPGEVTIVAMSAPSAAELAAAPRVTLAVIPTATSPADIEAAFSAAGVPTFPYLRIEVTLEGTSDGATPVFRWVHVQWQCNIMG